MADLQVPAAASAELRADAVHDRLREAILLGEIDAHAPISQVKLASRLGVSRTPLREAVRKLQREGLILSEPNRRIRVAPLSVGDLEELYAQRIVLEALALRRSVPRFEPAELRELRALLDRMHAIERARLAEEWEGPHRSFHDGLRRHAGERLADGRGIVLGGDRRRDRQRRAREMADERVDGAVRVARRARREDLLVLGGRGAPGGALAQVLAPVALGVVGQDRRGGCDALARVAAQSAVEAPVRTLPLLREALALVLSRDGE